MTSYKPPVEPKGSSGRGEHASQASHQEYNLDGLAQQRELQPTPYHIRIGPNM